MIMKNLLVVVDMQNDFITGALTAEGFGGREMYRKVVTVTNDAELAEEKRKFALQFGVELEMVKDMMFIWTKEGSNERTFKSV